MLDFVFLTFKINWVFKKLFHHSKVFAVFWACLTFLVVNTRSLSRPGLAVIQALGPFVPHRVTWPKFALSCAGESISLSTPTLCPTHHRPSTLFLPNHFSFFSLIWYRREAPWKGCRFIKLKHRLDCVGVC